MAIMRSPLYYKGKCINHMDHSQLIDVIHELYAYYDKRELILLKKGTGMLKKILKYKTPLSYK